MMAVISVENKISIRMASIFEEVRMRLYFKGEPLKRKDADYCVVQAGPDEDQDLLRGFVESGMNSIAQAVVKRMASFDWCIETPSAPSVDKPADTEPAVGDSAVDDAAVGDSEVGDAAVGDESTTVDEVPPTDEVPPVVDEVQPVVPEDTATDDKIEEEYLTIVYVPYERKKLSDEARMLKIAEKAIFNYLVNYTIGEWLGVVSPDLSREFVSRNDGLMFSIRKAFAGLSPLLRRRATDLGGI